jgi:hypothetical protein
LIQKLARGYRVGMDKHCGDICYLYLPRIHTCVSYLPRIHIYGLLTKNVVSLITQYTQLKSCRVGNIFFLILYTSVVDPDRDRHLGHADSDPGDPDRLSMPGI